MTQADNFAGCWPTRKQKLLLRAALLHDEKCIAAWEEWKSRVDVDRIDTGSKRLLPLVYRNLLKRNVEDFLMGKLKAVYRRTWYENQLLFDRVVLLITAFREAGIDTIVLKGAALALLYYKDCGLRPMNDFDVMVPVEKTSAAIGLMRKLNWNPIPRTPEAFNEKYLSVVHAHGFTHPSGGECDLHWHLLAECCQADADKPVWEEAVPFEIQGVRSRSLCPTDQLLHVCIHGAEWNSLPPIRWIADAMIIMNGAHIDWNRLIAEARKRRLLLRIQTTVAYLYHNFDAPVPADIMREVAELPVSKFELAEYKYKSQNYEQKPLGFLPVLWFNYLRLEGGERRRHRVIGFVKYLQRFWGADSIWQLPSFAALMALRRTRVIAVRWLSRFSRIVLVK